MRATFLGKIVPCDLLTGIAGVQDKSDTFFGQWHYPGAKPDRGSGKRMPTAADAGTVDELPGLRVQDVEDAGVVDGDTFPAWTSADGVTRNMRLHPCYELVARRPVSA